MTSLDCGLPGVVRTECCTDFVKTRARSSSSTSTIEKTLTAHAEVGPDSLTTARQGVGAVLVDATVVMDQRGALTIPAEIRAPLGWAPGDELHLHVAGRRLVVERPQDAVTELRALASSVPESRSLVDELLAERRIRASE